VSCSPLTAAFLALATELSSFLFEMERIARMMEVRSGQPGETANQLERFASDVERYSNAMEGCANALDWFSIVIERCSK
jgi:uncharacterized protein Yka (UPF0111/DUF47 family)